MDSDMLSAACAFVALVAFWILGHAEGRGRC